MHCQMQTLCATALREQTFESVTLVSMALESPVGWCFLLTLHWGLVEVAFPPAPSPTTPSMDNLLLSLL